MYNRFCFYVDGFADCTGIRALRIARAKDMGRERNFTPIRQRKNIVLILLEFILRLSPHLDQECAKKKPHAERKGLCQPGALRKEPRRCKNERNHPDPPPQWRTPSLLADPQPN